MKLKLDKNLTNDNAVQFMRRAGYIFKFGQPGEEMSFERPLAANGCPKFHIYLTEDRDFIYANLHLDQKRPTYAGTSAHSGEYDTDLVAAEASRLQNLRG